MFALYAAGGRNRIQVNTMTETRPVYHADLAGLATERRRALLYAALNDAGAAEAGLLRARGRDCPPQRDLLALGTLDDAALYAVRRQLGDFRQCAEALGVGL
jgi:hypothetical protein